MSVEVIGLLIRQSVQQIVGQFHAVQEADHTAYTGSIRQLAWRRRNMAKTTHVREVVLENALCRFCGCRRIAASVTSSAEDQAVAGSTQRSCGKTPVVGWLLLGMKSKSVPSCRSQARGRRLSGAASRYLQELFRAVIETDCKGIRKPELSCFGYRRTILVETIPFSALRESMIDDTLSASD
jgi:hypothetical protein